MYCNIVNETNSEVASRFETPLHVDKRGRRTVTIYVSICLLFTYLEIISRLVKSMPLSELPVIC